MLEIMSYTFFTIQTYLSQNLLDLLKKNIIGTPEKSMVYQHLQVQKKAEAIAEPYYVTLLKGEDIVGTCCFCSRDTRNAGTVMPSFYLRYFTFKSSYRIGGRSASIKPKQSIIRKEIYELLTGNGLGKRGSQSFFHYAYVDPKNQRSAVLCHEFGFEPVRTFSTILFHRMYPRQHINIEKISAAEVPHVKELLTSFYNGYTMFSFENLFRLSNYYVVRDTAGTIVAGVQATPDHWKILSLPGVAGDMLLTVLSGLPFLNRFIKKDYRFITFEGIYVASGKETALEQLFESLLCRYHTNTAML